MLKTVLESLDGLDEALSKLYTEIDGKFILQIEGVDFHPDVANLKNAYERQKKKLAEVSSERDALKAKTDTLPDDFDLSVWEKAKSGKADEAALVSLRTELEGKVSDAETRASEAEGKLKKFAVERDLSDALIAAGITDPSLTKGARAMLKDMVKTGDDGSAIVESDMGPLPLGDYVKKWVAGEGKAFVTPPSGGGRKGGDSRTDDQGGNPWKPETRNLTRQAEIMKSDPALANELKAAAGLPT